MTKNAQQALKYILQGFNNNVRFCLICNYISRIDESLQNEFMRIRFNQLPETEIINFLSSIAYKEGLNIPIEKIKSIQCLFKSDIRSMINYIQSNQYIIHQKDVIDDNIWINLTACLKNNNRENSIQQFYKISLEYNIEIKNIIKDYLNYIIHTQPEYLTSNFLKFTEFIIHLSEPHIDHIIKYTVSKLNIMFNEIS